MDWPIPIRRFPDHTSSHIVYLLLLKFNAINYIVLNVVLFAFDYYNQTTDFVIDLDNIWKWLGFQQNVKAKILLEKHFVSDKDYKISLMPSHTQKTNIIVKSEKPCLPSHQGEQTFDENQQSIWRTTIIQRWNWAIYLYE